MSINKHFNTDEEKIKKVKNCFYTIDDCINVMAQMKPESVNTIITSPPYNLNKIMVNIMTIGLWKNGKI